MYRKYNTDFLSKCNENYSKFNKKSEKSKNPIFQSVLKIPEIFLSVYVIYKVLIITPKCPKILKLFTREEIFSRNKSKIFTK